MESIKMVLMKLFAGKEWRCRCREQTCGHSEEEEENEKNGESSINIHPPSRVEQVAGATLPCNTAWFSVMSQRAEMERGEGGS